MKILADVNISPRVVAALRADGFDALRVTDIMPATASDEDILAEAARLGAVLVSQDQDFSALLAMSGATRPSHRAILAPPPARYTGLPAPTRASSRLGSATRPPRPGGAASAT